MRHHADGRRGPTVGAIGGCVIRIVDARITGQLEYLQEVESSLTPWEGRSGYTMLAANAEVRGIAIYYRKGFGFIFISGDTEYYKRMNATTLREFVSEARTRHGLELTGGAWED